MTESYPRAIVWLRRDLRVSDNAALAEAAKRSGALCAAFVVDPELLAGPRIGAPIVQAFFDALRALRAEFRRRGSDLALLHGDPAVELPAFARRIGATAVFYNEDYDPQAIRRDALVTAALQRAGIAAHSQLDHVYFAADAVSTEQGEPYKVFTPYSRRWRRRQIDRPAAPIRSERAIDGKLLDAASIGATRDVPVPEEFGFTSSPAYPACSEVLAHDALEQFLAPGGPAERYADRRDLPALEGTSRLSPHLRAGTIGIRTCFAQAFDAAARPGGAQIEKWIEELIWREFYQAILRAFPHVAEGPFIEAAAHIPWNDDRALFERWCRGETGYPIVDAAMTQLNATGWMHNRLRMIVASFLAKDLLLNWQWGERYFEQHLADADLAQNNGGWQWAASTGTDAVPYFRVFNPVLQSRKIDPEGAFIRAMLPALRDVPAKYVHAPWEMPPAIAAEAQCRIGVDYPAPIVDHAQARMRALAAYEPVLGRAQRRSGALTR